MNDTLKQSLLKANSTPRSSRQSNPEISGFEEARFSNTVQHPKESCNQPNMSTLKNAKTKKLKDKVIVEALSDRSRKDKYNPGANQASSCDRDGSFDSSSFETTSDENERTSSAGPASLRSKRSRRSSKHSARAKTLEDERTDG